MKASGACFLGDSLYRSLENLPIGLVLERTDGRGEFVEDYDIAWKDYVRIPLVVLNDVIAHRLIEESHPPLHLRDEFVDQLLGFRRAMGQVRPARMGRFRENPEVHWTGPG